MIIIHSHTKISSIIKANKDSVEAISSLAKPLEKLRNPVLRKVMAPRVTIAEAAHIGGCSVRDIAAALQPLGFQFVDDMPAEPAADKAKKKPAWLLEADPGMVVRFDVRAMISGGNDPLREILQRYRQLPDGRILCIINSFNPFPLINLMEKNKVASFTEQVKEDEYHTWFLKPEKTTFSSSQGDEAAKKSNILRLGEEGFAAVCGKFTKASLTLLDVRELEMPLPMQTILSTLKVLPERKALYVYHKRIPVYLLEELGDKGYQIYIHEVAEGDVRLLIFKNKGDRS